MVVMEQASEQAENEDRDDGQRNDGKAPPKASFWMAGSHRSVAREWLPSAVVLKLRSQFASVAEPSRCCGLESCKRADSQVTGSESLLSGT